MRSVQFARAAASRSAGGNASNVTSGNMLVGSAIASVIVPVIVSMIVSVLGWVSVDWLIVVK